MKLNALLSDVNPENLVKKIVRLHQKNAPEIKLKMAVWLNVSAKSLAPWEKGVELLEIGDGVSSDKSPEFRATSFGASDALPAMKLVLAHPKEFDTSEGKKYLRRLVRNIHSGKARVVFSKSKLESPSLSELYTASQSEN